MNSVIERLQGSKEAPPWTKEEVTDLVEKKNLLAEEVYVDPTQMLRELKGQYPKEFKGIELPPRAEKPGEAGEGAVGTRSVPDTLLRLFVWHRLEDDPRLRSKGLGVTEAFTVYVKVSLLVGVLLASPWIFYQIWSFVAAGLYPHERRYVHLYLPLSIGLFLFGAALAFFAVFKPVLGFLLTFNRSEVIDPELRINEWLRFVLILPVGFGIGFQLPLVMLFLERIGVLTVASYLKQWRIAVLVIFVVAGILMPPDPYSMILMASSLTFLYFGGVLLCKLLPKRPNPWQ